MPNWSEIKLANEKLEKLTENSDGLSILFSGKEYIVYEIENIDDDIVFIRTAERDIEVERDSKLLSYIIQAIEKEYENEDWEEALEWGGLSPY